MRILDCYFADYWDSEIRKISPEEIEDLEHMLEPLFLFSLVWSIGCTTNLDGRDKFDKKLRELMGNDNKYKFPG
jgi:dynein heavy chain